MFEETGSSAKTLAGHHRRGYYRVQRRTRDSRNAYPEKRKRALGGRELFGSAKARRILHSSGCVI